VSSRKELKEQRRRERLEAERRMAQQERRRRRLRVAAGGAALVIVAVLVIALQPWQQSSQSSETLAYDADGLQERIERAGLREGGGEHIHPKISVSVRGKSVPVPANMGLGAQHAPMHTHDPDGVMHVEGEPDPTLAEFMAVWGVRLTPRELGPYATNGRERVRMWVKEPDAKSFEEVSVRPGLPLQDQMEIYLGFGTDAQRPIT
jgi:hypothetical protein